MTDSILGQERAKAYREGLGQMAQVHADEVDEAYRRGRAEVWEETRPLRTVRFCFGLLWGVALSALVWSFWP